jgi:hypothetical protein
MEYAQDVDRLASCESIVDHVLLSIETDVNVFAHLRHGAAEQRQIGNLLEHPKQPGDIAIPLRLAPCFEAVAGNLDQVLLGWSGDPVSNARRHPPPR